MRVRKHTPRRWTGASAKGGYARTQTRVAGGRVAASGVAAAALLSALTLALLVWLVAIPATRVQAATYTVNVTTDDPDNNIGDGTCATAGGDCTLRAAIQEANASPADDVIAIGVGGPIVLTAILPTIMDHDLIITGSGQQVSQTAAAIAFDINADRVQISNLVIDGEGTGTIGIRISGATDDLVLDGVTVRGFTGDGFDNSGGGGGKRNTIRNSTFTANGGNGIDFNGGEDNAVLSNSLTDNGDNGLEATNEDGFLVQGNTFSGNANAQIFVGGMLAGQHMRIIQNNVISGSDGIVIGVPVNAGADIDIGLSVANRNVFRGTIIPAEQHVRNLSNANINAIFNDWDAYTPAAIEGVICHDGEAGCGNGVVDFDPFIDTPSPLATPTPPATATHTPTATPEVTATATPGGVETLPLIAGCNPIAWTGEDGTPIAAIAGAVAPPDILVALWEFEAGVWLGFSPQFPDVSDLTEKNRLDVVFVCVSAAGTFSRPVI